MNDNRRYPGQQCQDDKINLAFCNFHNRLVQMVIEWCRAYNISIDEFHLDADGLAESIVHGEWVPTTDSCLVFEKNTKQDNNEPYLCSY